MFNKNDDNIYRNTITYLLRTKMKCFCCQNENLKNFTCNELMKNNIDIKKIKICNTCITKPKYKNYINLETPELKRDLDQGILTKCEFCLNILDGFAKCACNERSECNNIKENNIYNNYINYLPNFSNFINFNLYPKDITFDINYIKFVVIVQSITCAFLCSVSSSLQSVYIFIQKIYKIIYVYLSKKMKYFYEFLQTIYFMYMLIHYVYLNCIWQDINVLFKTKFSHKVIGIEYDAVIYSKYKNKKKVLLLLSGAYNLECHAYINKLTHDLEIICSDTINEYEIICYEKSNKTSIVIYDDVFQYIKQLDKELDGIEELVLFGFSAGGVVASHIMQKCKLMSFKKRIITYDTPWHVQMNVESFKHNTFYRPDMLFFLKVHHTYSTHYNYEDIKQYLIGQMYDKNNNYGGADELVAIIKNVHQFSDEELYFVTGFNFDQTPDTRVYNIYAKRDPCIDRDIHYEYVTKNQDKIGFYNEFIEKDVTGHCSDMAFSTAYLKEIMYAIKDNH